MKKLSIIFGVVIGILVLVLIFCGVELHKKEVQIQNLQRIKAIQQAEQNSGIKVDGINFNNLNYSVKNDGNTKVVNATYTIAGENQKQQVIKDAKLTEENGKWVVSKDSKLTADQINVIEKLVNTQVKENAEFNQAIKNQMKNEQKYIQDAQKQMNQQIDALNQAFNQAINS
ncbi:MAG: hypothetical protein ACRC28_05915 [Clostridium sp.]|uniref:hypothetical protein n=1 Tax=Clostridium sp. TaxID=1506 RepID=UPI003F2F5C58